MFLLEILPMAIFFPCSDTSFHIHRNPKVAGAKYRLFVIDSLNRPFFTLGTTLGFTYR